MNDPDDWRRDIEEAMRDGDETHLRIVLDRVFEEIKDAVGSYFDGDDYQ